MIRLAPGLLLLAGLALRLVNAWTPLEERGFSGIPDDSFYYFAIARNLALGHAPSIDGLNATNGYHPLWMLMLVPLLAAGRVLGWEHGSRAPLHVAFTLGAVLDVAAGWMLYRVLRHLGINRNTRLLILAAFVFNPYAVELATWGLETPLALLLALAFLEISLQSRASAWRFGLLGGLMVLARTDHLLVLAIVWLVHALRQLCNGSWRWVMTSGMTATLVVLPWPIYSWLTVGALVQSSSLALAVVIDRLPQAWGIANLGLGSYAELRASALADAATQVARFTGFGPTLLSAMLAVGGAWAWLSRVRAPARARLLVQLRALLPWMGALLVLFLLHVLGRKVFREWYVAPFCAALLIILAMLTDAAAHAARSQLVRGVAALSLGVPLVMAWASDRIFEPADYRSWHGRTGEHVGQTDCGAWAYFFEATTTNLDGVANQAALEALRAGRLMGYVEKQGFQWIRVTPQLQSHVFFGSGYRERLRGVAGDPSALTVVSDAEKDQLVELGTQALELGSARGREFLSDGWEFPQAPLALVESMGAASEIIFVPQIAEQGAALELQMSATVVDSRGVQPVAARLNGRLMRTFDVGPELSWYALPADHLLAGRNRLRLEYRYPQPVRRRPGSARWSGWNWLYGNAVRAIGIGQIRFSSRAPALPPEGPPLAVAGSELVFRAGWFGVERGGDAPASIWATAREADMVFSSSLSGDGRKLVLEVGPPPPDGECSGQHVDVVLNGHPLSGIDLVPGEVTVHELVIPAGLLLRQGNHLVFTFERVAAPDSAGIRRAMYLRNILLH